MKIDAFCYVYPRYSCGSPAMVDFDTAKSVAEDEKRSYRNALLGRMGPTAKERAERLGLSGIAEIVREYSKGRKAYFEVRDLCTDEVYHVLADERRKQIEQRRAANAK